jgi:hypothetical protein
MKILVVTNLYPPHHISGYELGCRDVVEKLRERGHAVRVLTSTFRLHENSGAEIDVERSLNFVSDATSLPSNKRVECRKLAQAVKNYTPDVVYFWNQAGLCRWLPIAARWRGCRPAFFLSDTNFVSWRVGAWLARFAAEKSCGSGRESAHASVPKKLSRLTSAATARLVCTIFGKTFLVRGWPVIQNRTCHFASEFLRSIAVKNGLRVAPETSVVAHWGIELDKFTTAPRERWP